MKSSVIDKWKNVYEVFSEKCMELIEHIRFKLKFRKEYCSSLVEEYAIKRRYIKEDFVQQFLKEREKTIKEGRYKMVIKEEDFANDREDIVGYVTLLSRKKIIERATLVTKPGCRENERLVYWNFEK